MDPISQIQEGSDSRKNWRVINAQTSEINRLRSENQKLADALARERRRKLTLPPEAFQFCCFPIGRDRPDPGDDGWRTVQVQTGEVNGVTPDGVEEDIEVPEDTNPYYIWLECTTTIDEAGIVTVTAASIEHGADGWDGFPDQPEWTDPPDEDDTQTAFLLIAIVDTTDLTNKVAVINQNARGHLSLGLVARADSGSLLRRFLFTHPSSPQG